MLEMRNQALYLQKFLGSAQPNFWCSVTGVTSQVGFLLSLASCPGAQHVTFPSWKGFLGCSTSWIWAPSFLAKKVSSRGLAPFLVLSQKVQICCLIFSTSMAQLQYCDSAAYLILSFIFTAKQQNIIIICKTLFLNISLCILS